MICPVCHAPLEPDTRFCGTCGYNLHTGQVSVPPVSSANSAFPATVAAPVSASAPAQAPASAPGDMLGREIAGRYRIVAKLGEGGMGTVFRAEQISLKRIVALKLLRPHLSVNQDLVRRFNAEAELAARLNHPNTVTLHDFGQDSDGTLFIAMELVAGRSLREVVAGEGPLPPVRALAIAEQIASSLADAHAHGIVHRDLKPDNVMLSDRGKLRDVVRVLDFGIAKLRDDHGRMTGTPLTQAGALLGTPQYMAPEQIRSEEVDGRADIYALGAMLYEMVTGRLPFEAVSLMAVLAMHLNDPPTPPSRRRPDLGIGPAVDQLLMAALAKAPAGRPESMERFDEMIGACLAELGHAGTRPGTAGRMATSGDSGPFFTPAPISTPAPYGAHGAATPPAAAGMAATPSPVAAMPAHTPAPEPPAPRSRRGPWIALAALLVAAAAAIPIVLMQRGSDSDSKPSESGDETTYEATTDDQLDGPATPAVSSDFTVTPARRIFLDPEESARPAEPKARPEPDSPAKLTTFREPATGMSVALPLGFTRMESDQGVQFIGTLEGVPSVIGILPSGIDPRVLPEGDLEAALSGWIIGLGAVPEKITFRTISGTRCATGIASDPNLGMRYEFVLYPGNPQGALAFFGTSAASFGSTSRFRRKLFQKGLSMP